MRSRPPRPAEERVELVDVAERVDARVELRDARAVAEARLPLVARRACRCASGGRARRASRMPVDYGDDPTRDRRRRRGDRRDLRAVVRDCSTSCRGSHARGAPSPSSAAASREQRGLGRRARGAASRLPRRRRRARRTSTSHPDAIGTRRRPRAASSTSKTLRPRRLQLLGLPAERARAPVLRAHGLGRGRVHRRRGQRGEDARRARTSGRPPASRRPVALDGAAPELGELARPRAAEPPRGRLRVLRGARRDRAHRSARPRQARRTASSAISIADVERRGLPVVDPPDRGVASPQRGRACASATTRGSAGVAGRASRISRSKARRAAGRVLHPPARRPRRGEIFGVDVDGEPARSSRSPALTGPAELEGSLDRIMELPVERLLVSHGEPVLEDGKGADRALARRE